MVESPPLRVKQRGLEWTSNNTTRQRLRDEALVLAPAPWACDREWTRDGFAVGYTRRLWTEVHEEVVARLGIPGDIRLLHTTVHLILAATAGRATRNPTTNSPDVLAVRLGDMFRVPESGVVLHRITGDDQEPPLYLMAFSSEREPLPVVTSVSFDGVEP